MITTAIGGAAAMITAMVHLERPDSHDHGVVGRWAGKQGLFVKGPRVGTAGAAPAIPRWAIVPLPRCDYGPRPGDPSRQTLGKRPSRVNPAGGRRCGKRGERAEHRCGHPGETPVNSEVFAAVRALRAALSLPTACGQSLVCGPSAVAVARVVAVARGDDPNGS